MTIRTRQRCSKSRIAYGDTVNATTPQEVLPGTASFCTEHCSLTRRYADRYVGASTAEI